jgi:hypothetical protein
MGRDLSPRVLAGRDGDQLTDAVACAWFGATWRLGPARFGSYKTPGGMGVLPYLPPE